MSQATEDTPPAVTLAQELELRLAEARGTLSGNDQLIAQHLRVHHAELAFQTAESLAQGCDVSAAAVVRFARRLGYASFRELRDRARAELRQGDPTGGGATGPDSSAPLDRKTAADIASLALLPRLLGESLETAARLAARARSIWFLANRETHGLAVYAHRLLRQARSNVELVNPAYPDPIRDLGPEDVVIVCTFRPYARNTLELLADVRACGVQIILVTDGLSHDFIAPTDLVLPVPVDSPTLFLSFTPALCVLETLAAMIAAEDPDQTYESLESYARFTGTHGLMLDRSALPRAPEPE